LRIIDRREIIPKKQNQVISYITCWDQHNRVIKQLIFIAIRGTVAQQQSSPGADSIASPISIIGNEISIISAAIVSLQRLNDFSAHYPIHLIGTEES
jgi:hypothetical protein